VADGYNIAESWNGAPTTTVFGEMGHSFGSDTTTNPDGSTVSANGIVTPASTLADVFVGSLIAGFKWIGNLFFTKGIILAALFFFIDFFINLFLELVKTVLDMNKLTDMIHQIPFTDFMKYLLYLGAFDYGIPLLLSAYLLKFFIRRLPVVG
jgi:hypothetical protein